jgi:hypothetical protein
MQAPQSDLDFYPPTVEKPAETQISIRLASHRATKKLLIYRTWIQHSDIIEAPRGTVFYNSDPEVIIVLPDVMSDDTQVQYQSVIGGSSVEKPVADYHPAS